MHPSRHPGFSFGNECYNESSPKRHFLRLELSLEAPFEHTALEYAVCCIYVLKERNRFMFMLAALEGGSGFLRVDQPGLIQHSTVSRTLREPARGSLVHVPGAHVLAQLCLVKVELTSSSSPYSPVPSLWRCMQATQGVGSSKSAFASGLSTQGPNPSCTVAVRAGNKLASSVFLQVRILLIS